MKEENMFAKLFVSSLFSFWIAFVAKTMYTWFFIPLGLPNIPYTIFGGIMEFSNLFRLIGCDSSDKKITYKSIVIGYGIVPAIYLFSGYVWVLLSKI